MMLKPIGKALKNYKSIMEHLHYTLQSSNEQKIQQFAVKTQKVRFRETTDIDLVRRFQQQLKKATLLKVGLIQAI